MERPRRKGGRVAWTGCAGRYLWGEALPGGHDLAIWRADSYALRDLALLRALHAAWGNHVGLGRRLDSFGLLLRLLLLPLLDGLGGTGIGRHDLRLALIDLGSKIDGHMHGGTSLAVDGGQIDGRGTAITLRGEALLSGLRGAGLGGLEEVGRW